MTKALSLIDTEECALSVHLSWLIKTSVLFVFKKKSFELVAPWFTEYDHPLMGLI